jgi:predicted AlkP superfamily pyrophosphatase or phosphodiesterase
VPGRASGPTVLWDPGSAYETDGSTIRAARAELTGDRVPGLLVVCVADVDRASHRAGPDTPLALTAIRRADRLLDGLLTDLTARGLWERAVVLITSDHGFFTVAEQGVIGLPTGTADDFVWIDEGPVAFGHPMEPGIPVVAPAALLERPGVAGVRTELALLGLGHPRAGALMLVAEPGFVFTLDAGAYRLRGDHGGEADRLVPLVVLGGHPALRRLPPTASATLPDIGPTISAVLGVPAPRSRREGVRSGRVLPLWSTK